MYVKALNLIVCLSVLCFICIPANACTTIIVTKGASSDGSVFVAHSDDSEMFDNRLIYVPAADHKPGSMRPVYFDACSIGNIGGYNSCTYRRYVGESRGPGYINPMFPKSIPIGEIPQVEHTYAYFDANYGIMNEHQLMFGECTDGSLTDNTKPGPSRLFYSAELSRVALERCKTAREAVKLIGHLIDTYGFYGTGETLPVADPNEGWVIEMVPGPRGCKGLWVAKKVPDGEIFVAANEFRIRDVEPDDPDMMHSKNLFQVAEKQGWWKPSRGKLDWLKTVSLGEYNHPYYSLRRVWRLFDRIAPSKKFSPWVKDGYTRAYPFSVKPDKKMSVRDVMMLYRDHYEGTPFDLTKGPAAGPFGCPYRYAGPYDASGDVSNPKVKRKGAWERPLSIFRCGYSFVCQGRSRYPDHVGGILWFGEAAPAETCYVPFFVGVNSLPEKYTTHDIKRFSTDSAWWVFNFVKNFAAVKYSYIIKDINKMQDAIEHAEIRAITKASDKAAKLYAESPLEARKYLTRFSSALANDVVSEWWELATRLIAKYSDGYVNTPDKLATEVGYPEKWLSRTLWKEGPVSYAKPKKAK